MTNIVDESLLKTTEDLRIHLVKPAELIRNSKNYQFVTWGQWWPFCNFYRFN